VAVEVDGDDDGAHIGARRGRSKGGGEDLEKDIRMGCVPLCVFERESASRNPQPPVRSMRSTSLVVTVLLEPVSAASPNPSSSRDSVRSGGRGALRTLSPAPQIRPFPWQREPVISWSNF
jgi:hypothetical protein